MPEIMYERGKTTMAHYLMPKMHGGTEHFRSMLLKTFDYELSVLSNVFLISGVISMGPVDWID